MLFYMLKINLSSFHKYLLYPYYVPGTIPGTGDSATNKSYKGPCPWEVLQLRSEQQ